MNREERIKAVKAMEFLVRQVDNEDVFMEWLGIGVADGDIPYGETELNADTDYELDYYIEDSNFASLMWLFLQLMTDANEDGGLYCDGIESYLEEG